MLKLRYLIILGLLLTITACGGGDRKKMLVRKWKFDVTTLKKDLEKASEKQTGKLAELGKQMSNVMVQYFGKMTLEFKADGNFEVFDGENSQKETWKLSEDKSEIITTSKNGKETRLKVKSMSSTKVVLEADERMKKEGGVETITLIPA